MKGHSWSRQTQAVSPMTVGEIMVSSPVSVDSSASVAEAAETMRQHDLEDVLVVVGGRIFGILTGRDIAFRATACGKSLKESAVGTFCTKAPVVLSPDDSVDYAVEVMRQQSIRRLPVAENGVPVGTVSLADLAVACDRISALGHISPQNQTADEPPAAG